jgi:hypothetical protein
MIFHVSLENVFSVTVADFTTAENLRSIPDFFRMSCRLFKPIDKFSSLWALAQPYVVRAKKRFDESVFHDNCMLFSTSSVAQASETEISRVRKFVTVLKVFTR